MTRVDKHYRAMVETRVSCARVAFNAKPEARGSQWKRTYDALCENENMAADVLNTLTMLAAHITDGGGVLNYTWKKVGDMIDALRIA